MCFFLLYTAFNYIFQTPLFGLLMFCKVASLDFWFFFFFKPMSDGTSARRQREEDYAVLLWLLLFLLNGVNTEWMLSKQKFYEGLSSETKGEAGGTKTNWISNFMFCFFLFFWLFVGWKCWMMSTSVCYIFFELYLSFTWVIGSELCQWFTIFSKVKLRIKDISVENSPLGKNLMNVWFL